MAPLNAKFIPFSAQTRISGIDVEGVAIRKGAVNAVLAHVAGGTDDALALAQADVGDPGRPGIVCWSASARRPLRLTGHLSIWSSCC